MDTPIAFVAALVALAGVLAGVRTREGRVSLRPVPLVALLGLAGTLIIFVGPAVGQVPAGHRGVLLTYGAVSETVLGEGFYLLLPVVYTVERMDVQSHAYQTSTTASSHDLQNVTTEVVVNYHVRPEQAHRVYQSLRREYVPRVIAPALVETVKQVAARYPAEALITQRQAVKDGIEQALRERVQVYGIDIEAVSITTLRFSDDVEHAIELKVTAEQQALKAENDLRRIRIEAQQVVERGRGEAEAIRMRAEALAQNPLLVQLEAVQKWDGKMPQIVLGEGAIPLIQIGERKGP